MDYYLIFLNGEKGDFPIYELKARKSGFYFAHFIVIISFALKFKAKKSGICTVAIDESEIYSFEFKVCFKSFSFILAEYLTTVFSKK